MILAFEKMQFDVHVSNIIKKYLADKVLETHVETRLFFI